MKALVTGHGGFVGRHLWSALRDRGYELVGVDIAPPAPDPRYSDDLRSLRPEDARDFFRNDATHYDLVIHCAAIVGGRATIDGAPLKVAVDLAIDAEMFQWALRTGPGQIVYYSSSAAYPIDLQAKATRRYKPRALAEHEIDLDVVRNPDMSYGWAKLTGEMLARFAESEGLRVHVFRPFSGYGEDQALEYPFPSFIERAARREDPFTIWGDGHQVRDFIHISDVVGATFAAIEHDIDGPVNLCTGIGTSFNELAAMVSQAVGYEPVIEHKLDAPIGVAHRVGDPTKMHTFYEPTVSLMEGIGLALAWRGKSGASSVSRTA